MPNGAVEAEAGNTDHLNSQTTGMRGANHLFSLQSQKGVFGKGP